MLAFFILMVCSCTTEPMSNEIVSTEEPPPSEVAPDQEPPETEPQVPEEPEDLPFEFILEPDFDRSGGIYLYDDRYGEENLTFDLNELPVSITGLSPGKWSINEVEERFGKPEEIYGYLDFWDPIEIIIKYTDVKIVLNTTKNRELSFDTDSNPVRTQYPLSEEDKDVKMWLEWISLYSPLPRGLIAGESTIEQVKAAYPPDSGRELKQIDEHILMFSYVDFDKLAISTKNLKPDIIYLFYNFYDDILGIATRYFET